MPFTAAWDETAPDGSVTPANTIDSLFKELKRDVRERMDEILGAAEDWETDPIIEGTLKKSIRTLVTEVASKTTVTGLTSGQLIQATGAGTIGNAGLTVAALLAAIAAPSTELGSNSTTNDIKFDLSTLASGLWLITFYGTNNPNDYQIEQPGLLISSVDCVTTLIQHTNGNQLDLKVPGTSSGDWFYRAVKII